METPLVPLSHSTPSAPLGLCWPGAPDSEVDELAVKSIHARRDRAVESFAVICQRGSLSSFIHKLSGTPAMDALSMLDNAWSGAVFRRRPAHLIDDVPFEPATVDRIRWALAGEAEHGAAREGVVVSPPGGAELGYLYFPVSHLLLHVGRGPVAIARKQQSISITTWEGRRFTLPRAPGAIAVGTYAGGALLAPGHAGRWPLLNGIPLYGKFAIGTPVAPEEAARNTAVIREALQLIGAVWPEVKAFAERWLRGVLVLAYPGHSRSHTSVHAPQVLMCSTESASKIGEALCHELSHARMLVLLESDRILDDDHVAKHRSAWRGDARPLMGLVNGVHAFLNVCRYYQRLKKVAAARWGKEADTVLKVESPRIAESWSYIQKHARWTELGTRVACELENAVKERCN